MFGHEEYISDYESEACSVSDSKSESADIQINPLKDKDLSSKPKSICHGQIKPSFDAEHKRNHNQINRHQLLSLDAYDRHKKLVNDYLQYYGGSWNDFKRDKSTDKTDLDLIKEHGRFLWSEQDVPASWSERLAKRYWDKLFKEYCLVDLSRYRENKFGMRWRVEKEVVSGKGQFTCGCVHCDADKGVKLRSWEVNFAYKEKEERRNALVKLRLCPKCSDKLNYRSKRRDVTGKKLENQTESLQSNDVTAATVHEENSLQDESLHSDNKRARLEQSTTEASDTSNSIWTTNSATSRTSNMTSNSNTAAPINNSVDEFDEYFADMFN